jgi:heme-degrading monooxygenase HmoA
VSEFRSIIWFKVRPGAETDFESAFDDAGMLTRPIQIDGFGGAELLRSTTSPHEYYVVGTWSSPAAYAAWHAISNNGAPPEALARLIDSIAEHRPGQLFRAVNMTDPGQPTTAPSTSPSV